MTAQEQERGFEQTLALALALALVAGCGKSDEGDASIARELAAVSIFTAAELLPGAKLKALDAAKVKARIESESAFVDREPPKPATPETPGAEPGAEPSTDACREEAFDGMLVKGGKDALLIAGEVDLGACFAKSTTTAGAALPFAVDKAVMKLVAGFGCPGTDFAPYDGKTFKQLTQGKRLEEICPASGARSTLFNVDFTFRLRISLAIGGTAKELVTETRSIAADSTLAGGACTTTVEPDALLTSEDCVHVERTITTVHTDNGVPQADEGAEDYLRAEARTLRQGITGAPLWFRSGKFALVINDWSGEVLYVNETTAPSYAATKGAETVAGTVVGHKP